MEFGRFQIGEHYEFSHLARKVTDRLMQHR